ncbi:RNase adapter RapZ [Apilactobacillus ozensis]|uniref:GlmZ(SRNA)-inactivating NTPase n=1 Tax=Apilactobacillus ozensis DSM 23829 = JCM 17196 TaxID=1423781 RepID=A0A0R2AL08_9LACO|nr:RNase adapter RapZ [Apilactobacillus ozensis]KRM67677.1 glmZ(sRNA)-inactivating NTPase [Apilactobacillus ozensis DSM 23829 = JCM 17196]MCK8607715.1 RNase adapter RapZ [Apilactobacillus ozensis]
MKFKEKLVVITGMSGAGKTVAVQAFEDIGYFCVDNMPPSLIPKFIELIHSSGKIHKIALVMDLRSQVFHNEIVDTLFDLSKPSNDFHVMFLDASNDVLVSRYKEKRRSHPMDRQGRILDGIVKERSLLNNIKGFAQEVLNTSSMSPNQLRKKIQNQFNDNNDNSMDIQIMSFGFKYGLPVDADLVMDVRFLPNPYYEDKLRYLTGKDKPVYDYVFEQPDTGKFYTKLYDLLSYLVPRYEKEGKPSLTIAIGCTGGQHRSVAIVEKLASDLSGDFNNIHVSHRDLSKSEGTVNAK